MPFGILIPIFRLAFIASHVLSHCCIRGCSCSQMMLCKHRDQRLSTLVNRSHPHKHTLHRCIVVCHLNMCTRHINDSCRTHHKHEHATNYQIDDNITRSRRQLFFVCGAHCVRVSRIAKSASRRVSYNMNEATTTFVVHLCAFTRRAQPCRVVDWIESCPIHSTIGIRFDQVARVVVPLFCCALPHCRFSAAFFCSTIFPFSCSRDFVLLQSHLDSESGVLRSKFCGDRKTRIIWKPAIEWRPNSSTFERVDFGANVDRIFRWPAAQTNRL